MTYRGPEREKKLLTPTMETALTAMRKGPLEYTATGWRSGLAVVGCWNSITISILATRQYCRIVGRCAEITVLGRETLNCVELGTAYAEPLA